MITHHGTYIDGFAAPQATAHPDTWAAQMVLEMTPKWFRDFWFCDIKPDGIKRLRELKVANSGDMVGYFSFVLEICYFGLK